LEKVHRCEISVGGAANWRRFTGVRALTDTAVLLGWLLVAKEVAAWQEVKSSS